MYFSSIYFVFLFLPFVIAAYYLFRKEYRNYVLLAASLIFYAYGEPEFVFVMIASIFINWFAALRIDSAENEIVRKFILIGDIIFNIGLLFIFKYLDLSIGTINLLFKTTIPLRMIPLPIGISFFTFQAMSYVIDIYRRQDRAQKNPLHVALYISFFPQLVAGPIVRYHSISQQILDRSIDIEKFGIGAKRFITGFCKKVILANNLAVISEPVFTINNYSGESCIKLWIGVIAYTLQIYYDFSGYSDMAIGLAKMFGFELAENFEHPYISGTITEFWKRWHISLSSWFRDYVYIPLGGSRRGRFKQVRNLFIVWLLTGIWHGANYTFILWGLIYFFMLIIEKFLVKPASRKTVIKVIWRMVTLFVITINWAIFNSSSLHNAFGLITGLMGRSTYFRIDPDILGTMREYGIYIFLSVIFSFPIIDRILERIKNKEIINKVKVILCPILYCSAFLWAASFLILGAHNPFIYFNF